MKKFIFVLLLPLLIGQSAQALVQLRAGYGIQTPSEQDYNSNPLSTMAGYNLDALVNLPLLPFGFGLRYEDMGFDYTQAGQEFSSSMQRTSLLVNYRFIDMFLYLGAIGSIGFANSAKLGTPLGETNYDSSLTYSIGAEGGISLGLIKVGAELGYLSANFEVESGTAPEMDLSGVYAKAIVGFGF